MKKGYHFLSLLLISLSVLFLQCVQSQGAAKTVGAKQGLYQCLPCGYGCDTLSFDGPGECLHCHMPLVKKSTVVFKTIEPSAICEYIIAHPDVVLLDVRTKEEFEGKANPDFGTLKSAINIPVQELKTRLPEINQLRNKEIIVYCSHSHRSPTASYLLTQNGFTNVTNMSGGMSVMNDNRCKK